MTTPYALTIQAPRDIGYDIAETLGFDVMKEALAVSVFDVGVDALSVQALYETEALANAARADIPPQLESTVTQLPKEDWVGLSQSGLPPIKAGRFFIHGSHDVPSDDDKYRQDVLILPFVLALAPATDQYIFGALLFRPVLFLHLLHLLL